MDGEDIFHTALGSALAALSLMSLYLAFPLFVSVALVLLLCLYIILLLVECGRRSKHPDKAPMIFSLPNRGCALLLAALLIVSNVSGFASIYLQSKSIEKAEAVVIDDPVDALYFSSVTVTTLGYGDFLPNSEGRKYVIFQLASGLLLLLFVFPVIASRVSNWQ